MIGRYASRPIASVAGSAEPYAGRRVFGAFNPAVVTSIIDFASTGAQVAGGIVMSREQRFAQQAAIESQARLEAAKLQAQQSIASSSSGVWIAAVGGLFAALTVGIVAWAFTRRRR